MINEITHIENYSKLKLLISKERTLAIYCCGPTIYQDLHKGNYRPLILLDYIYKLREEKGYETKVVVNITDIDDKIFNWFENKPIMDITQNPIYIKQTQKILSNFYKTLEDLGTSYKKWNFIRVSEELDELRKTILNLKDLKESSEGLKKEELPFYLWKGGHLLFSKNEDKYPDQGHPSWHLECAHIIKKELGQYKKILHLGGIDLKVLHHPNEVSLLKSFKDHKIEQLHFFYSGMYMIEGRKMSKSLKNQKYISNNVKQQILNFYLSDFNRPLVETISRLKEIKGYCLKLESDQEKNKSVGLVEENLFDTSPSMLYRSDKLPFLRLMKRLYPSIFL